MNQIYTLLFFKHELDGLYVIEVKGQKSILSFFCLSICTNITLKWLDEFYDICSIKW